MITTEGLCVMKTDIEKGEQKFNHIINPYTKLDPTVPRIKNIKCPNGSCSTNENSSQKETDIIYMRYDDLNMKYLYLCVDCDTVWKTDDIKN
jgi:aspartate carbamoyltransferase regulatory subunit